MPFFAHLDGMPLQSWDESRLATNALEMTQNGDLIVTSFDGKPDMWNTKPPLMIWIQAGLFKIIGYNEVAVLLPSALAALFTCILLFWFIYRKLSNPWLASLSALVLMTSAGYVVTHGTRTGDYDALLTFFTTAQVICFFWYQQTGINKWLIAFFVSLILAVLTKGVAGLFFLPGILLCAAFNKNTIRMLKTPTFYYGILAFIVIGIGYYILREHYNKGYIDAVFKNELGGRFGKPLEREEEGMGYYILKMVDTQYSCWYLFLFCGIAIGCTLKDAILKRFVIFTCVVVATFILIISVAATKNRWYILPAYPLMAILTAVAVWYIVVGFFANGEQKGRFGKKVVPYIVTAVLFFLPYRNIVDYSLGSVSEPGMGEIENASYFLRENLRNQRNDSGTILLMGAEEQSIGWYRKLLKLKGIELPWVGLDVIKPGHRVATFTEHNYGLLNRNFYVHRVDDVHGVHISLVDSVKLRTEIAMQKQ